jgi:hypothetical protein
MKKTKLIIGLAVMLASSFSLFALPSYTSLVPNGTTLSCTTCHTVAPTRNSFGNAFAASGHAWSVSLAALDSDGDGFSNGLELGDTAGTWAVGNANPAGPIFNPGDATSHPIVAVVLESSATVGGSYTQAAGQSVNLVTRTITVPVSGSMRFYRISAVTATAITNITISGGNVVIAYTP